MAKGDLPELTLFIVDKDNKKQKTIAGAAWGNEFGGFSLKLNPGIVLRWNDEVYLNLNPRLTNAEYAKLRLARDQEWLTPCGKDDLSYLDDLNEEEEASDEPELGEETRSD